MDENLKMTIIGYDDPRFLKKSFVEPFKVQVNPETYSQSVKICFSSLQAQGTSANDSKHNHTEPQKVNFEFLLDRTGALGNYDKAGVEPDVEHFKELTLNYEGSIHKPRYLMLLWGKLIFFCHLQSLDVEYKMFNKDGVPVRAILKTTFREFVETKLRVHRELKSSPDLTHVRIIKAGDTLPMLSFDIYGDPGYYLEIAKANNIINFRKLEPGREIIFPPINKIEI